MTDFKKHFAEQIANGSPCTGEYMPGFTEDEAVAEIMKLNSGIFVSEEDAREYYRSRVKLWAEHKGEHLLFYFRESTLSNGQTRLDVLKLWESELESHLRDMEYISVKEPKPGQVSFPKFRKKFLCSLCQDEGLVEGSDSIGCGPTYETCQCQ